MGYPRSPQATTLGDGLDFLVTTATNGDDDENLQRLQRFVYEAATHPVRAQWETEASIAFRYIENDFYTQAELDAFAERGQPPTRRNELAPIMERIAGQFIQTRQIATFLGRNTPADDPLAALAQDYLRHNDHVNQFEFEEQDVSWDGLVGGVGWYKQWIKTNELGQEYECVRHVNPFHVFKDPYATRYDPNDDAKYICEGSWLDLEDLIALVPEKEDDLTALRAAGSWSWTGLPSQVDRSLENADLAQSLFRLSYSVTKGRVRCRPFEVWYKRKVRLYALLNADGVRLIPVPLDSKTARAVIAELGAHVVAKPVYEDRMYTGMFVGNLLLHHDVSAHHTNLFPYTPFYSGLRKNGGPLGLSFRLLPICEAINKRESKALTLLSNNKVIAEKSAVEDPEQLQEENAKPDGYLEVRDGALSQNKILFQHNLDMGQAQLSLLQEDKDAIRRVSGQGNESMGMPSEVRSGTGIARKQMMGALIVLPVQNNLRRTRYMKARLSFAYMKQYLTEEMTFQITDDPSMVKTVSVTRGALQSLKEYTYDLVITEMKDYAVLREQQAEMLLTVLPQLAKLGPGMVKLGIQMSEFRDKETLMQMVEQQAQPQPEHPKVSLAMNWIDLTPEMQAYYALAVLKSPELAQVIASKQADPAFLTKIKAELASTQVREGTRATVERGKLDLSALQTATQGKIAMHDILTSHAQAMAAMTPPADQGATV